MPHVNSSGGDDLASTDEVKVYHDEGEDEERSSENLSEDKLGLLTETEEEKDSDLHDRNYTAGEKSSSTRSQDGKTPDPADRNSSSGYPPILAPYPYHNGSLSGLGSKMGHLTPPLPLMMYNNEFSPPPAHMGIPPVHIDPKTGLPRHPMYTLPPPPGQFPLYTGDFPQWNGYPLTPPGLRGPYGPYPLSTSPLGRFSPPGLLPTHLGLPPGLPSHLGVKTEHMENGRNDLPFGGGPMRHNGFDHDHQGASPSSRKKRPRSYVKKPLNAFMLFMKQERQKVIEEGTLKESAAINQILGRRWHALDRSEQSKYYDMARKEKELHMQLYPGWSARDNYAAHAKKKKTRGKRSDSGLGPSMSPGGTRTATEDCTNPKKCRARFGLDQQSQWCKPCRRKKKCIRFMEETEDHEDNSSTVSTEADEMVTTTTAMPGDDPPSSPLRTSLPPPVSLPAPISPYHLSARHASIQHHQVSSQSHDRSHDRIHDRPDHLPRPEQTHPSIIPHHLSPHLSPHSVSSLTKTHHTAHSAKRELGPSLGASLGAGLRAGLNNNNPVSSTTALVAT